MQHLFNSVVRVEELSLTMENGRPSTGWVQAHSDDPQMDALLARLKCRLDLNFVRPGKDILPAVNAGKAPDRIGVLFTYGYAPLKAGQRVVAIEDDYGRILVDGTFEIRVIPDKALDYFGAHHIEVQILETNQNLEGKWPWDDEEDTP